MPSVSEAKISESLVKNALERKWFVSVNDGEEWTVKMSNNAKEIIMSLATTGDDTLRFRDREGTPLGYVWLVWGNHEDVISDYSDNDLIESLVKSVMGE